MQTKRISMARQLKCIASQIEGDRGLEARVSKQWGSPFAMRAFLQSAKTHSRRRIPFPHALNQIKHSY